MAKRVSHAERLGNRTGGDGTRLQSLTQDRAGNPVPKQFCSFNGVRTSLPERRRGTPAMTAGAQSVEASRAATARVGDLTLRYAKTLALDAVSLAVPAGCFVSSVASLYRNSKTSASASRTLVWERIK